MNNESPLTRKMSDSQMRKIAALVTQHSASVLTPYSEALEGATVELVTDEGARVTVDSKGRLKWLKRDEVI